MNKAKELLVVSLSLIVLTATCKPVQAAVYYIDDEFDNLSQVDMSFTTAGIDTENGWVTLARKNAQGAVGLYEDSCDITIINGKKVETYSFNGSSMIKNEALSINCGLIDPISISTRSWGEYVVLDQGDKRMKYYNYDGLSMVENNFLSIGGFSQPLDVAVQKDNPDLAVLYFDGASYYVGWYSFDGTGMILNEGLSLEIGPVARPVSLGIQGANYAFAVVDKANNEIRYYSLNGGIVGENPLLSIIGPDRFTDPKSISTSGSEISYAVVDNNNVETYQFNGSYMEQNSVLSVTNLNKPLAVALKPGSYDFAVLCHDDYDNPIVNYYAFNGTVMEKIEELTITGIEDFAYGNDQVLSGKAIFSNHTVLGLKLQADVELPAGTNISWEVTVDGGITWSPITNNGPAVRFIEGGNLPNYRAFLHTNNPHLTPKILSVKLIDASLSIGEMRVTSIIGPMIHENPSIPTSFPPTHRVYIWAGYNVAFEVDTTGEAKTLAAIIRAGEETINLSSTKCDLIPLYPVDSYNNTWTACFHTSANTPAGTILDIFLTASRDGEYEQANHTGFAVIEGSALLNHPIHLTH